SVTTPPTDTTIRIRPAVVSPGGGAAAACSPAACRNERKIEPSKGSVRGRTRWRPDHPETCDAHARAAPLLAGRSRRTRRMLGTSPTVASPRDHPRVSHRLHVLGPCRADPDDAQAPPRASSTALRLQAADRRDDVLGVRYAAHDDLGLALPGGARHRDAADLEQAVEKALVDLQQVH